MKKLKYKKGDILVWHREWFTPQMDMKIVVSEIINVKCGVETYNYKAKFYKPNKNTYDGWNIFKEEELYPIGYQGQMSLF